MDHEPTTITCTQAVEIAHHLGRDDWQALCGEMLPQSYKTSHLGKQVEEGTRAVLAYVGSDPDLDSALLVCVLSRQGHGHGSAIKWHWCGDTSRPGFQPTRHLDQDERAAYGTSIYISPTKPLVTIARDVQKRLIGPFLPAYRVAMQRFRIATDNVHNAHALAQELGKILGAQVRLGTNMQAESTIHGMGDTGGHLRVSATGNAVFVERLSLNPDQARQFCALVAKWKKAGRTA